MLLSQADTDLNSLIRVYATAKSDNPNVDYSLRKHIIF